MARCGNCSTFGPDIAKHLTKKGNRIQPLARFFAFCRAHCDACFLRRLLFLGAAAAAPARALAAAAVRETLEETGLIIGKPDAEPFRSVPENWRTFFNQGVAPCFENLNYVARAVTPAWRPIRFNARFFMIDHRFVKGELGGDGELLNLVYVSVSETKQLELPLITTRVLELVEDLAFNPPNPKKELTITNFKHNGKFHEMYNE